MGAVNLFFLGFLRCGRGCFFGGRFFGQRLFGGDSGGRGAVGTGSGRNGTHQTFRTGTDQVLPVGGHKRFAHQIVVFRIALLLNVSFPS